MGFVPNSLSISHFEGWVNRLSYFLYLLKTSCQQNPPLGNPDRVEQRGVVILVYELKVDVWIIEFIIFCYIRGRVSLEAFHEVHGGVKVDSMIWCREDLEVPFELSYRIIEFLVTVGLVKYYWDDSRQRTKQDNHSIKPYISEKGGMITNHFLHQGSLKCQTNTTVSM